MHLTSLLWTAPGGLHRRTIGGVLVALLATLLIAPAEATARPDRDKPTPDRLDGTVRVATFNASLNRPGEGDLRRDLSTPKDQQARNVAEIIQRTRPDVLLLQEFDHDPEAPGLFSRNYLERGQSGAEAIHYPYRFTAPVNTGVQTGFDLDRDGEVGGPGDAHGFGDFPGQYGMVVYSKHPIDTERVRTFQNQLWKDMPGALLPTDPESGESWYTSEELDVLRLSSKSHWDVPVRVGRRTVHVLASHPTPPVFDGPEDRNGLRNSDEIRFWKDYVSGPRTSRWIRDDAGRHGGLDARSSFVVAGDLNSDPHDGDSRPGSIGQLLEHPRVNTSVTPTSRGALEESRVQGGVNLQHEGPPEHDTADFAEPPGNIRADYVLPSRDLRVRDAAVFWPTADDPLSRLTGEYPFPSSDHRLVWVDLEIARHR
ncbi:endonuclease/exonuclease/phosphatase family protein [Aeromicrobium sp. CTD01-1L150]|uniref:endonuclease/exonuclease/phosphatase family protein n=1 Tax=Aeromicrobium sp. CTD01-1L150 TaxID=3341830 RepID=UPI0035C0AAAB